MQMCTQVTNLNWLWSVGSIGGNVLIASNDALISTVGLCGGPREVGGYFSIAGTSLCCSSLISSMKHINVVGNKMIDCQNDCSTVPSSVHSCTVCYAQASLMPSHVMSFHVVLVIV
jgi:hypothetical protein